MRKSIVLASALLLSNLPSFAVAEREMWNGVYHGMASEDVEQLLKKRG